MRMRLHVHACYQDLLLPVDYIHDRACKHTSWQNLSVCMHTYVRVRCGCGTMSADVDDSVLACRASSYCIHVYKAHACTGPK